MSRLLFGLLALAAVVLGLVVGAFNADRATLDLLWVQLDWPLGLLVLCAFALGLLVGMALLYLSMVLPLRFRLRRSRSESAVAETPPDSGHDI